MELKLFCDLDPELKINFLAGARAVPKWNSSAKLLPPPYSKILDMPLIYLYKLKGMISLMRLGFKYTLGLNKTIYLL